jgi:hypothetical protein
LRAPVAFFYAAQLQTPKALEILTREVHYQIQPPAGGWKAFDGTPTPDTNKPRPAVSPRDARESASDLTLLLDSVTRCAQSAQVAPPLLSALTSELTKQIKVGGDAETQLGQIHKLAALVKYTSYMLIPPVTNLLPFQEPPTTAVDITQFTAINDVVRQALAVDALAKQTPILLKEGLLPAIEAANNDTKLSVALFALLNTAVDRYQATGATRTVAEDEVRIVVQQLSSRDTITIAPYVERLRTQYLQPK